MIHFVHWNLPRGCGTFGWQASAATADWVGRVGGFVMVAMMTVDVEVRRPRDDRESRRHWPVRQVFTAHRRAPRNHAVFLLQNIKIFRLAYTILETCFRRYFSVSTSTLKHSKYLKFRTLQMRVHSLKMWKNLFIFVQMSHSEPERHISIGYFDGCNRWTPKSVDDSRPWWIMQRTWRPWKWLNAHSMQIWRNFIHSVCLAR